MLRSTKNLIGQPLHATDSYLGEVSDLLFDDREWGLRYLVADTRKFLKHHKVLISSRDLDQPEVGWFHRSIPVKLTQSEIENCPPLDSEKTVSQLYEKEFAQYHRHQAYWEGAYMWGAAQVPKIYIESPEESTEFEKQHQARLKWIAGRTLRSTKEIIGYTVKAKDGEIGEIVDLIMQTDQWRIRHLVVDTNGWRPNGDVLIDVEWAEGFDWPSQQVLVTKTKKKVKDAPPYQAHDAVNRDDEELLYDYYGEPRYWEAPPLM